MKFEYQKVFKTNRMHAKVFDERFTSVDFPFANKFVAFVHCVHRMKAIAAQVFYLFYLFSFIFSSCATGKACTRLMQINHID